MGAVKLTSRSASGICELWLDAGTLDGTDEASEEGTEETCDEEGMLDGIEDATELACCEEELSQKQNNWNSMHTHPSSEDVDAALLATITDDASDDSVTDDAADDTGSEDV